MTLNEKKYNYKTVNRVCVKRCQNIFYRVKKRLVFGCFRIEEVRDKDNETGLKEGGGIEIEIYSAFPYTRLHSLSFAFDILTLLYDLLLIYLIVDQHLR